MALPFPTKDLLLDRSHFDVALTALDGLSADIENDWLITSPNSEIIPQPQWGRRQVRLRRDCRFGFDDFTLWPQAYIDEFRHLGAIPTKPTTPNDPLSFMWWNMTENDFVEDTEGFMLGLGQISPPRLTEINDFRDRIAQRAHSYLSTTTTPPPKLRSLLKSVNHSASRLGAVPATFAETKFGVAEFQRLYLELRGLLDFVEIYLPRIEGSSPAPDSTAECIGAFTSNLEVAQQFFDARIPVYLMRHLSTLGSKWPNIHRFVATRIPDRIIELRDASPPFPVIYEGSANSDQKQIAIHGFSRSRMMYKDPFGELVNVNVAAASARSQVPNYSDTVRMSELLNHNAQPSRAEPAPSAPARQSASDPSLSASRKRPRNDSNHNKNSGKRTKKESESHPASQKESEPRPAPRDKFNDFTSSLLPPCIQVWIDGLKAVDRSHPPSSQGRVNGQYVLPDPYLFVTPQDDLKKASFLRTWVRARRAMKYAIEEHLAGPVSSQTWRTFLDFGRLSNMKLGHASETRAAQDRDGVREIFGRSLERSGLTIAQMNETNQVVRWRGEPLPEQALPPNAISQEILWELFELSFRIEFYGLDLRLSALQNLDPRDRERRLLECFPGDPHYLLDVQIPPGNFGLASPSIRQRRPYLHAMADVIRTWPNCPSSVAATFNAGSRASDTLYELLEKDMSKFYVQSFFNVFGRAAILPRRRF